MAYKKEHGNDKPVNDNRTKSPQQESLSLYRDYNVIKLNEYQPRCSYN